MPQNTERIMCIVNARFWYLHFILQQPVNNFKLYLELVYHPTPPNTRPFLSTYIFNL